MNSGSTGKVFGVRDWNVACTRVFVLGIAPVREYPYQKALLSAHVPEYSVLESSCTKVSV